MPNKLKIHIYKIFTNKLLLVIFIPIFVSGLVTFYFNAKLDMRASQREFIYNFGRTFFDNSKYRNISIAIEDSYLHNNRNILEVNGGEFTDYEIDDYLNLLQELYLYGEEGFLSYDLIENRFDYYVCITHHNKEIQGYLKRLASEEGFVEEGGTYSFLEEFAQKLGVADKKDCRVVD